MRKLITYIVRAIILGAYASVMSRELGVTDIVEDLPFGLPQPYTIADTVKAQAKRLGYHPNAIVNIKRKGLLVRLKDDNDIKSELEAALEVNVYLNDGVIITAFIFQDGTGKTISVYNPHTDN